MDQHTVLLATLELAVPMHREQLRGLPPDLLCEIAERSAVTVGTHGDDLQFGGKHCRQAFNALARGLAYLALTAWGGVTWCGLHWCADPACRDRDADHDEPTWPGHTPYQPPVPRPVEDVPTHGRT